MVFNPVPASDGAKTSVVVFTPGPEKVPPSGIPPFNLYGLALIVVIVSKHVVKVTFGDGEPIIKIFGELAGLPVTQARFDVITQRTLSPFAGLYEQVFELVPTFAPLTFH
jgi:hypothetical protein